jgi:hypothetical protein
LNGTVAEMGGQRHGIQLRVGMAERTSTGDGKDPRRGKAREGDTRSYAGRMYRPQSEDWRMQSQHRSWLKRLVQANCNARNRVRAVPLDNPV